MELELNSLEAPVETQMTTVTHKQQIEGNKDNVQKPTMTRATLIPTITKMTENIELFALLVRHVAKRNTP